MLRKGLVILSLIFVGLVSILSGCGGSANTDAKSAKKPAFPTKDIEVVVPFSAGGGSDTTARLFSKIISGEKFLPVNLNVINKPGGSAAVGMNYVAGKKGDPHTLLLITPSYLTTPLQGGVAVNHKNFTPIAILGFDEWFVVVKPDGPFKTIKDLIEAAKKSPGGIRIGGASKGSSEHILVARIADKAGVEFNYVPFAGGSNLTTAVMGGHIEAGILNVSEASSLIEAKQLAALVTPGASRINGFDKVPTLKESGIDIVMAMPRGVVAPGNIPPESAAVLGDAFRKLSQSQQWQKEFVQKFMFTSDFRGPKEADAYLVELNGIYSDYLKKLGIIK